MDWLNLVEFQQLKRLTMKGNCVDEYECVDADDDAFLCARKAEDLVQLAHLGHRVAHQWLHYGPGWLKIENQVPFLIDQLWKQHPGVPLPL